jgi:uncharacterized protein (TIGR00369 family)
MIRGKPHLPPYGLFLGITAEEDADGPLFRMPYGNVVVGRPHFVHGGAIAGLLEIAAVGTVMKALAAEHEGASVKPITVTVDFMRGGRERDTYAAATIERLGNRIANVEATAWQESRDKPIASARMTLMVRRQARGDE